MKTIITKLLMLAAVLPASVNASYVGGGFTKDGIQYSCYFPDGSDWVYLYVTRIEDKSVTEVSIPSYPSTNGYPVIRISGSAFSGCSKLKSITLPNTLESIGSYAFLNCSSLPSITIPESVSSLEYNMFDGCENLTEILVNENNNYYTDVDGILYTKDMSTLMSCPPGYKNTSVYIEDAVTKISSYAFNDCINLQSIDMPNSVTSIEEGVFYNCTSLQSIDMPNSVTSIGINTFYNCTSLQSIGMPNSVTSIVVGVFYNCTSLQSIDMPNSVTSIGKSAFYNCTSLQSIDIPNSVTSIGANAFNGCQNLTLLRIGNSVNSIASGGFTGCPNLRTIYLTSAVPPKCSTSGDPYTSFFDEEVFKNATLYIPEGSMDAYKAATPWCYFYNISYAIIEEPIITINKRNVKISCGTEGAEIHYTLDGSTPDQNSTKYEGPFTINENCTVKAVAFKEFWDDSEIASKEATGIVTVRFKQEENSSAYNGKSQMPEIEANGDIDLSEIDIKAYRSANDDSWTSVPTENVKNTGRYKFELSVDNETTYGKSTAYLTITKAEPNLVWNQTFETMGVGEKVYLDFSCDNTEFLPVFSNYNEKVIEIGTDIDGDSFKWYVKGVGKGVTNLSMSYAECDNYFASETITKIIMVDGNAEIKTTATPTITINKRNVEISCDTEDAEIYYTLDGTIPNVNSTKYSGQFKVNENCTVKAIATKESWQDSEIAVNNVTEVVNVKFKQEENTYVYNGSSQMPEIETNGDVDLSEIDIKAYTANGDYWITIPIESVKNAGRYKFELSIDNETTYGKSTAYLTITKAEPNFVWNQTFDIMNVGKKIYLDFSCDNTESMPVFSNYDDKVIGIGSEIDGNGFKWYVEAIGKGVTNLTMSYAECENYFASETITKTITVVDNAGISDMSKDNIRAYGNDGVIHIANCEADALVNIYTASGTLVYSGTDKEIALKAQGIYIVRVSGQIFKVIL